MTVVIFSSPNIFPSYTPQSLGMQVSLSDENWTYVQALEYGITSDYPQAVQAFFNSLGVNASFVVVNPLGFQSKHVLMNRLSEGLERIQSLVNQLSRGDLDKVSYQKIFYGLVWELNSTQSIINTLSNDVTSYQTLVNALKERRAENVSGLVNTILEYVEGQQSILLSLKDAIPILFNSQSFYEYDGSLPMEYSGNPVTKAAVIYDIFIDGISVKDRITSARISFGQGSIHNTIDIESSDMDLFWDCDPFAEGLVGESRIEVQVGGRVLNFMLESRDGDDYSFTVWGRSLSAKSDEPYAENVDYMTEEVIAAKDIAEDIVTKNVIDWNIANWMLKKEFEFQGSPIQGLQQIASIIGAIVRSQDDGSLTVRYKYPTRPANIENATVDVNYDRDFDLIALDYSEEQGPGYTAVDVDGYAKEFFMPTLEVEEPEPEGSERYIGDITYVRAYWSGRKPEDMSVINTVVTDGEVELIETDQWEETEEEITFEEGEGSASKPVDQILEVTWIGDDGGDVTVSEDDEKNTSLFSTELFAVATIKYRSKYDRYKLYGHDVKFLLFVLYAIDENALSFTVKLDVPGDKKAQSAIENEHLTTENVCVIAGQNWLDDNYYDIESVSLEVPYHDKVMDGNIIYINDYTVGCVGKYHIVSADIIFDGPKVTNQIEVIKWHQKT